MYIALNGYKIKEVYNLLLKNTFEVKEASNIKYFNKTPLLSEIKEIEIGIDNTEESILRLNNGGYVVVNKTLQQNSLKK